jgi:rod shape-determining protein MreD
MVSLRTKGSFLKIYSWLPILILYISVLNEFDFNYLNLDYFSFNFPFILIFFFTLKDFKHFDYILVFIAGLFNDTVVGLPLGISSLSYTLICIATAYLRNITIRPNSMKDWFYFLFIISLINSLNYSILTLFFSFDLILMNYLVNTFFTFSFYIIFVSLFKYYLKGLND